MAEGWEMEEEQPPSPKFTLERRIHSGGLIKLPLKYCWGKDSRIRPGHIVYFSENGSGLSVCEQMEINEALEIIIYFIPASSLITM